MEEVDMVIGGPTFTTNRKVELPITKKPDLMPGYTIQEPIWKVAPHDGYSNLNRRNDSDSKY